MMRIDFGRAAIVLAILAVGLVGYYWFTGPEEEAGFVEPVVANLPPGVELGMQDDRRAELGEVAPDFILLDTGGAVVKLSDYQGEVVLVNFWATWCLPCRQEMPDIASIYASHEAQGFNVLALNLAESRTRAGKFAADFGLVFPILLDTNGVVAKAYRISGVPESWIVGRDGTLIDRKIGVFTLDELETKVGEWISTPSR